MAKTILDRFGAELFVSATATTFKEALEEALAVPQTDFQEAALAGADLTGADLTGIDLTNADLYNAILTDAILTDAILTGAVLTGAIIDPPVVEVVSSIDVVSSYDISGYDGSLVDGILKLHIGADLEYNQINIIPFMAAAEVNGNFIGLTIEHLIDNTMKLSGVAGISVIIKKDVLLAKGSQKLWLSSSEVMVKNYAMVEITISGFIG